MGAENTYTDVGYYDSKDGIGRVESGTETESNAYVHGWTVLEQRRTLTGM